MMKGEQRKTDVSIKQKPLGIRKYEKYQNQNHIYFLPITCLHY